MLLLYNFGIRIYEFLILISQPFNQKARSWISGRKNLFSRISDEIDPAFSYNWFHFASLGEFEQGRPVMEELKRQHPAEKIVITFFSPSGYELRKNYTGAEHIYYLPIDTKNNAKRFIELVRPKVAIFTKYEYWFHYFNELNKKNVPLYIISGVYLESQPFFKWYGGFNRRILQLVSHFFVQDAHSKQLLAGLGRENVTVSGDTRFDRVAENSVSPKQFAEVEAFCGTKKVFVAGSTWPDDEKILAELVKDYPEWKFIIAPHEIKEEKLKTLTDLLPQDAAVRYSAIRGGITENISNQKTVLIIDNIGMLSSLYQYGQIAYIGGGFGVGIHNTLEAAAFGIPVLFGPNYQRFLEAKALLKNGGGFTLGNEKELKDIMLILQDENKRNEAGSAAGNFVQNNKGATPSIMKFLNETTYK